MITKQPFGISPTLEVLINNVGIDMVALNRVELFYEIGKHDMAVLHLAGVPPKDTSAYRNQPVSIKMSLSAGLVATFYGYIIEPNLSSSTAAGILNGSPFQDARLVCMGTSYQMRDGNGRVWTSSSISDVARELAPKYGWSYSVPADPFFVSPMIQNESDWQFINRYANDLGFDVTLHGTHLHIFDPYKAYDRNTSYHQLITARDISLTTQAAPGQISDFKVYLSENRADGVYKDTVVSVHQHDSTVFEVKQSQTKGLQPGRIQNRIGRSAPTYEQALRAIDVESKRTYDFRATALVVGLPGCVPGGIVNVVGYGSADTDGLWYVESVRHDLTSGAFITELKLAKNIRSELFPKSGAAFTLPPEPKLVDNQWVASLRIQNAYT